jgi:ferredoxin-NADP reductase
MAEVPSSPSIASSAAAGPGHLVDAAAPLWNPDEDEILVCRQIRAETADVKTFVFTPREPRRFAYEAGQFITLELEIAGEVINRCYTLSSSPARPHAVSITVKRVPGGPVSNWLHDNLQVGSEIKAVGPMGEFTSWRHPAGKYLFLSGGSGITPLMSMARSHYDMGTGADITFVHAARSPLDIIFRRELETMAEVVPAFNFVPVCEAESPGVRWSGYRGRLSLAMLHLIAPDFAEREVFVCGPAPFMAAVRVMLAEAGFDMAHHHEESFDFAALSADEKQEVAAAEAVMEATPPAQNVPVFRVEFTRSRKVIECPADMSVLDASRKAGMRLPSSCSKGLCGTCKSKKISGEVEMHHGGGIRQREIDQGMVLICCSKPLSDLVIER